MDKQNVVYPYNGISFSHKKEWSTDTGYNIDEPCKHYAKGNRLDTKGQYCIISILYDRWSKSDKDKHHMLSLTCGI